MNVSPIQLRFVLASSGAATESDRANPASTIPRFPPLTDRILPDDHADGGQTLLASGQFGRIR